MTNLNEKSIETHRNSASHLEDIHQDDAGIINGSNNLPVYKGLEGIETWLAIIVGFSNLFRYLPLVD
jgi:hypothetical protein